MMETIETPRKNLITMGGEFQSFELIENGVKIETDHFLYDVVFYQPQLVRIHQYLAQHEDTNPYSVVANPEELSIDVEELEDSLVLVSDALDVVVDKSPVRVIFLAKDGSVINEDDQGLGIENQGEHKTVFKKLQEGERFMGLGEKTGPLDKRGKGYLNWNSDAFGYNDEQDPLYASIPFYIGTHSNLCYGIYLDNSYKSYVNFGASTNRFSSFSVDGGDMDYYFFTGSVKEIVQDFTWLTGRLEFPPLWSIGYQQCRYSYYPDREVLDLAEKFRAKDIPADVVVLDIHYMDDYKIFTWDSEKFPDPKGMIAQLQEMGFEVVVIFDPGIKIEEGYHAYEEGIEQQVFLKYPDGTDYEGEVWPGWCHFPDFTNSTTRDWWKKEMESYAAIGVKGYWNDMNEIATWGQSLPENLFFEMDGKLATTRKGRNLYGFQMARSSYEGAKENLNGKRPFNLTRSAFAGVQRYGALWTGDNVSSDEHLLLGVRIVNNLGLSGVAFAGYDVGGFVGNANSGLFIRWIQVGAFSPFFRGHSMINSMDSEPWAFGEEAEEIATNFIKLRYKLMPYIYQLFVEASEVGTPICRSLAIDYTFDAKVYDANYENQYLFGPSILVAPMRSDTSFNKIYLPKGEWYEFFLDQRLEGNQEFIREYAQEHFPVFVKASAVLPMYPDANQNTTNKGEVLELHLYNGVEDNRIEYYEDDGVSYDFQDEQFHRRTIDFSPSGNRLELHESEGKYSSVIKTVRLVFHGFTQDELVKIEGLERTTWRFVKPISSFDPFDKRSRDFLKSENVYCFEQPYSDDYQVIEW